MQEHIFCANDDIHVYEPWITDGTAIGTHLIKDMLPPYYGNNDGSNPRDFTEYHNKIYFTADVGLGDELYCTDGTEQVTNLVKDIYRLSSYPYGYIVFQDTTSIYQQTDLHIYEDISLVRLNP